MEISTNVEEIVNKFPYPIPNRKSLSQLRVQAGCPEIDAQHPCKREAHWPVHIIPVLGSQRQESPSRADRVSGRACERFCLKNSGACLRYNTQGCPLACTHTFTQAPPTPTPPHQLRQLI